SLVQVGMGKWDVAAFTRIRDAKDRAEAGPTAPPQGLYLTHIDYELDCYQVKK
ncbi:MAG: tRNA pseudouridine(38-40) synthase TruA, partial [Candidatus Puniceispirillaceae bacterium]